jgi:hypothetical protein
MLLVVPADLWLRSPPTSPELMNYFVRHFVVVTWWVGAVAGASLLWRHGNRKTDFVYGLVAGAVAGLVGSATLACFLPWLDWLPRLFWGKTSGPLWLWRPLWIPLAAASWALWGALAGFLGSCAGHAGARILDRVARALAWLSRLCGLRQAAAYFEAS